MRNARILDSKEVDELFRNSGMEPLESYLGASKPRKSRCLTCGKISTPTYAPGSGAGEGSCALARERHTKTGIVLELGNFLE